MLEGPYKAYSLIGGRLVLLFQRDVWSAIEGIMTFIMTFVHRSWSIVREAVYVLRYQVSSVLRPDVWVKDNTDVVPAGYIVRIRELRCDTACRNEHSNAVALGTTAWSVESR